MSTETEFLPFKEYSSTLSRYSDNNQLQAHQYKSILESELGQAYFQREFNTIEKAAQGPMNANLPRLKDNYNIKVKGDNVNVYKEFWQYKQPGATIFTDWNSAGVAAIKEDMSVRDLPLHGHIHNPTLVLSNTNNIRNNFQNYGKEYLTTTNMLNAEAFAHGVSYESGSTSTYRSGTVYEMEQIKHGNFKNREDGDIYSRQIKQLRVDLPINYANTDITSWNYINPICIILNNSKGPDGHHKIKVFHEQLKFGIFDLDSMKLIGTSCLTENFNMIPQGFTKSTNVINDKTNYPPLENPEYFTPGENYYKKDGEIQKDGTVFNGTGSNLYCSANTNFVAMPKNNTPRLKGLDTSFQVFSGTNSLTLGAIMSPKLKEFIQNDLFKFNEALVVMQIYSQEIKKMKLQDYARQNPGTPLNKFPRSNIMRKIENHYPNLFLKHADNEMNINFNYFMGLEEGSKYTWIFNMQRNFAAINQGHPELETFINHLSIFKFGGHNVNFPEEKGRVRLRKLSNTDIPIEEPGCFTLLPTMLSEDVFTVRKEIPQEFNGSVNHINKQLLNEAKAKAKANNQAFVEYTPIQSHGRDGNSCIIPGANFETNATNCAFRDKASMWQQKLYAGDTNPNFVPKMFNDPNNYNNDIFNLNNPYASVNPNNSPPNF
jgi:hypothetical protein